MEDPVAKALDGAVAVGRAITQLQGLLAERDSWDAELCSVGRALNVVGTRSAMLVMREAFYGTRRFDDFARRVGITEAIAAARLKELLAAGLLRREPYQEPGQRTRYEYRLTQMGRDLLPAVLALMQWGDRYLTDDGGPPPIDITHAGCGAHVGVEIRCEAGHHTPLTELRASSSHAPRPELSSPKRRSPDPPKP
jgi:DNA-binding HxlR family transcriptional regulator